jgi:hypothetical protein
METMSYLVTNIPLSPFFIIAASSFYYTSKPNHLVLFLQAPVMVAFTLGVLEVERRYGKSGMAPSVFIYRAFWA